MVVPPGRPAVRLRPDETAATCGCPGRTVPHPARFRPVESRPRPWEHRWRTVRCNCVPSERDRTRHPRRTRPCAGARRRSRPSRSGTRGTRGRRRRARPAGRHRHRRQRRRLRPRRAGRRRTPTPARPCWPTCRSPSWSSTRRPAPSSTPTPPRSSWPATSGCPVDVDTWGAAAGLTDLGGEPLASSSRPAVDGRPGPAGHRRGGAAGARHEHRAAARGRRRDGSPTSCSGSPASRCRRPTATSSSRSSSSCSWTRSEETDDPEAYLQALRERAVIATDITFTITDPARAGQPAGLGQPVVHPHHRLRVRGGRRAATAASCRARRPTPRPWPRSAPPSRSGARSPRRC